MSKRRKKFILLTTVTLLVAVLLVCALVLSYRKWTERLEAKGITTSLSLQTEEFPRIDGTYFMQAYGEAVESILTGRSITKAREYVLFTGPDQACSNLLQGDADLIFLSEAKAAEVVAEGKKQGIQLLSVPIAYDGHILYTDIDSPEEDLSAAEFQQLYESGDARYGSSTFCYYQSGWGKDDCKLLSVDGVLPGEETISNGHYGRSYAICAVIREADTITPTKTVLSWILGSEGQAVLTKLGYINRNGDPIPEGAGANAFFAFSTRTETSADGNTIRSIKGSDGNPTSEGMSTHYLVENPIICTNVHESPSVQAIEISGLLNKTAQDAINNRIAYAAKVMGEIELPTYRGARLAVPDGSLLISTEVTADVLFNYNNVLSVQLTGDYTYALADEQGTIAENAWGYYANTTTIQANNYLNFDLNTGRELSLANVFVDGADYLDLLSMNMLSNNEFIGHIIQAGSYKRMRADQKFYLHGDALYIVYDYDSPEFILYDLNPVIVPVYFGDIEDQLAVTARYYSPEVDLYESDAPHSMALIPTHENEWVTGQAEGTSGEIATERSWKYSAYLSSFGKNQINALSALNTATLNNLKRTGLKGSYKVDVTSSRVGNYLTVAVAETQWVEGSDVSTSYRYHCYDLDALKECELSGLFWAGYDYTNLLAERIGEEVIARGGLYQSVTRTVNRKKTTTWEPVSESELEKKLNTLAAGITDFAIDTTSVYVSVEAGLEEGNTILSFQIPFSEFGCDNMTLFWRN